MSLVVQIFSPSTMTANSVRFRAIITSKISFPPTYTPLNAPKQNIRLFPRKKAMMVVQTAAFGVFAKRAKLGVAVPPLTKEPITIPAPVMMLSPWLSANFSVRLASPVRTAITMAAIPSMAIRGTEI